jgi:putative phosphoserine phosphatase / 1-acylglycerol-3-phosphate O-acyltransferase
MSEHRGAAFVDLDRTLIRSASGPVFHDAMIAEGVLPEGQHLPGERLLYGLYAVFGESVPFIALARAAATVMKGRSAEATRRAGKRAVEPLVDLVQPFALETLAAHRRAARPLVLATTSPADLVTPLADALGFDGVIATRYEESEGRYTGGLDGGFVWGVGKRAAAAQWAADHGCGLRASFAYSDSFFDLPLFRAVGHPHPVNADPKLLAVAFALRWPIDHWDRAPGVPSMLGLEPYHLLRPFVRPAMFPYARFDIRGTEHIPRRGPVLLASNHRSYFDVAALALVAARIGRPVRFLGKQEIFDAPVVGQVARALGGIPVDRGSRSGAPMRAAAASLRAGELVVVLPQGTIPRDDAFFDPVLKGRTGTARLAAESGAPVVPVGIWGTDRVWPRSAKLPDMTTLVHPPKVTVAVGPEVALAHTDAVADTEVLMAAIGDLLPEEAHAARVPTPEELARTRPSA